MMTQQHVDEEINKSILFELYGDSPDTSLRFENG